MTLFLIFLGSGIGGVLRYCISWLSNFSMAGTIIVNLMGSFLIGVFLAYKTKLSINWQLFLAIGLLGGFTTFSAFSKENLIFMQNNQYYITLINISISIIGGLIAACLGYNLIK